MSAAAKALLAARLAGVTVARQGDRLRVQAPAKPSEDLLEALRQQKPAILKLLDSERCEACRGPGTPDRPLLECALGGYWLLLHRACLHSFLDSGAAASDRYAPQRVCDFCGEPGGKLENVGHRNGPVGGVPVHLDCAAAWFARLNQIKP
jgi:hypothetical protein